MNLLSQYDLARLGLVRVKEIRAEPKNAPLAGANLLAKVQAYHKHWLRATLLVYLDQRALAAFRAISDR